VATSPLVIVVRPGNPRDIHGWRDLTRDDVAVVHPDPTTSGAGVWSLLAQYAAAQRELGPAAAVEQLRRMHGRVVIWPASAAAARTAFGDGVGDALVTYAHDVTGDTKRPPLDGEVLYPAPTMLTEHIVVRGSRRGGSPEQQQITEAFLAFLWSDQATALLQSTDSAGPSTMPHASGSPPTSEPSC
ncbi:MAG: substrate-binding domain-containing protein, partial [Acidobacteriota bacterium]